MCACVIIYIENRPQTEQLSQCIFGRHTGFENVDFPIE